MNICYIRPPNQDIVVVRCNTDFTIEIIAIIFIYSSEEQYIYHFYWERLKGATERKSDISKERYK